jgi:N-hydroxyarylamine O-acetyltransferase
MEPAALVDRYLAALDLQAGPPTRALLEQIVRRHVATFPFASIGPRLGDELPLAADALFDRIVVRRRGGYCFEQNGLLFAVLTELGYEPRLQLARVVHNTVHEPGDLPGLTHRISLVELDGVDHVVDVGFGPSGPPTSVPMPSDRDALVESDDEWNFRVVAIGPGQFHLQCRRDGAPYSLYRFDSGTFSQADCELGHFYSHRHPKAAFVNHLVASRILDGEIRSMRNLGMMVLSPDGSPRTTIEVRSAEELSAMLRDDFHLDVTEAEVQRLYADLAQPSL